MQNKRERNLEAMEVPPLIDVVSDLHFNFWSDLGARFIYEWEPAANILVIAGDLANYQWFRDVPQLLQILCEKYKHVFFIAGNHDYYGTCLDFGDRRFRSLEEEIPSLHFLERDVVTVEGITFAGTTLWFRNGPFNLAHQKYMNDFYAIEGFGNEVYNRNASSVGFLSGLKDVDVVITHHLPSHCSIAPMFEGDALTKFFLCDVEETICTVGPKLWVHGHTHVGCDYVFDNTRIVCHPRGYQGEYEDGQDPERYKPLPVEI